MTPRDLVLTPRGLRFAGRIYPCTIGKSGLTDNKCEGDSATPRGCLRIVDILYRPDRIRPPHPDAYPIGLRDLWSDDPQAADYNHLTRAPYPFSHECLRRSDPLYDLILVTDWNWPKAEPRCGSAIFVHQYRRPAYPTEGCIALSRRDLHHIAARIDIGTRLIIR